MPFFPAVMAVDDALLEVLFAVIGNRWQRRSVNYLLLFSKINLYKLTPPRVRICTVGTRRAKSSQVVFTEDGPLSVVMAARTSLVPGRVTVTKWTVLGMASPYNNFYVREFTGHSFKCIITHWILRRNNTEAFWTYHTREEIHSALLLSLIHIWRCRRYAVCRSRWSPYH